MVSVHVNYEDAFIWMCFKEINKAWIRRLLNAKAKSNSDR